MAGRDGEKCLLVYESLCDIMFQPSIQRAETDWYFMYCCGVRPHTVAWGYIIYPVPCLVCRATFRYNSKSLHYATVWEVTFYFSLSLFLSHMTTKLCPWCWWENKTNTTSSFLSIARFVPDCVSVWSILIIDHHSGYSAQKWGIDDSATMDGYFQRDTETLLGNS